MPVMPNVYIRMYATPQFIASFLQHHAYASNCALDRHTKLQILLKTVYHDKILILVCFIAMTPLMCADMHPCREH